MTLINIETSKRVAWTMNQGETIAGTLTVTSGGVAANLSGWSATFRGEYADVDAGGVAQPAFEATIGSGITVASNVMTVKVQTSGLDPGRINVLFRTVDAGGVVRDAFTGTLTLVEVPS